MLATKFTDSSVIVTCIIRAHAKWRTRPRHVDLRATKYAQPLPLTTPHYALSSVLEMEPDNSPDCPPSVKRFIPLGMSDMSPGREVLDYNNVPR